MGRWIDTQVYVLGWRLCNPPRELGGIVYHAHGRQYKTYDDGGQHNGWIEETHCGRLISQSTFVPHYQRSESLEQLHVRIAELFARPCKRCYEVDDDE